MSGMINAIVTGQNVALKSATPIAPLDVAANAAAIVVAFNLLLAELKANSMIKE